jgi:protein-disulfide isomerase
MREHNEARLVLAVGARDHAQGPSDAPVTLVEYGDYECPYCGSAYPIVKQIQHRLGDRLRFVFRNFPLSEMHPHAEQAAEAAEAAATQNRFWPMHDMLFENQEALDVDDLRSYAHAVGIDAARFDGDMQEHTAAARIREDFLSGVRSGVNGTPTFFINGLRHDDSFELAVLLAAVEEAAGALQRHGGATAS